MKTYTVQVKLLTRRGNARHQSWTWIPFAPAFATLDEAEAALIEARNWGREARIK